MVEAIKKISIYTHTERSQMNLLPTFIYFTTQKTKTKKLHTHKTNKQTQKPFITDKFQIRKLKNSQVSLTFEIQRPKTSCQSHSK